jgi:hypothetical protein
MDVTISPQAEERQFALLDRLYRRLLPHGLSVLVVRRIGLPLLGHRPGSPAHGRPELIVFTTDEQRIRVTVESAPAGEASMPFACVSARGPVFGITVPENRNHPRVCHSHGVLGTMDFLLTIVDPPARDIPASA